MKIFVGLFALAIFVSISCALYVVYLESKKVDLDVIDALIGEDTASYRFTAAIEKRDLDPKDGRRLLNFLRSAAESGRNYKVTKKNLVSFEKIIVRDENDVKATIQLFFGADGLVIKWQTRDRSLCFTSSVSLQTISEIFPSVTIVKPDLDE